jgi:FkbM family methyltransferase
VIMINWSGINHCSIPGRLLRLPLKLVPRRAAIRIRRGPAKGLKWVVESFNHGCWLGTYELAKQKVLATFVENGMTVYDIGANAGFYTLFLSKLVGPTGHVYAFEPGMQALSFLWQHVRMNELTNVTVVQAAVGSTTGLIGFSAGPSATNSCLPRSDGALLVPLLRLDDTGLPAPDLIKMDIEGAEPLALQGAKQILESRQPILFIALHGERVAAQTREILSGVGYTVYALNGQIAHGPLPDEIYALR